MRPSQILRHAREDRFLGQLFADEEDSDSPGGKVEDREDECEGQSWGRGGGDLTAKRYNLFGHVVDLPDVREDVFVYRDPEDPSQKALKFMPDGRLQTPEKEEGPSDEEVRGQGRVRFDEKAKKGGGKGRKPQRIRGRKKGGGFEVRGRKGGWAAGGHPAQQLIELPQEQKGGSPQGKTVGGSSSSPRSPGRSPAASKSSSNRSSKQSTPRRLADGPHGGELLHLLEVTHDPTLHLLLDQELGAEKPDEPSVILRELKNPEIMNRLMPPGGGEYEYTLAFVRPVGSGSGSRTGESAVMPVAGGGVPTSSSVPFLNSPDAQLASAYQTVPLGHQPHPPIVDETALQLQIGEKLEQKFEKAKVKALVDDYLWGFLYKELPEDIAFFSNLAKTVLARSVYPRCIKLAEGKEVERRILSGRAVVEDATEAAVADSFDAQSASSGVVSLESLSFEQEVKYEREQEHLGLGIGLADIKGEDPTAFGRAGPNVWEKIATSRTPSKEDPLSARGPGGIDGVDFPSTSELESPLFRLRAERDHRAAEDQETDADGRNGGGLRKKEEDGEHGLSSPRAGDPRSSSQRATIAPDEAPDDDRRPTIAPDDPKSSTKRSYSFFDGSSPRASRSKITQPKPPPPIRTRPLSPRPSWNAGPGVQLLKAATKSIHAQLYLANTPYIRMKYWARFHNPVKKSNLRITFCAQMPGAAPSKDEDRAKERKETVKKVFAKVRKKRNRLQTQLTKVQMDAADELLTAVSEDHGAFFNYAPDRFIGLAQEQGPTVEYGYNRLLEAFRISLAGKCGTLEAAYRFLCKHQAKPKTKAELKDYQVSC